MTTNIARVDRNVFAVSECLLSLFDLPRSRLIELVTESLSFPSEELIDY